MKILNICLTGVLLCCSAMPARAETVWKTRVGTGLFTSVGDYGGEQDTRLIAMPTSLRVRSDRWGIKLTVPWVQVDGPGNLSSGDVGGSLQVRENEQSEGLGDTTLDLIHGQRWGAWFADWTFKTKFPTADDEAGLGTGATDYEMRLDLARRWHTWTGFGHVAYRQRGETAGDKLQDTPGASVGLQREFRTTSLPVNLQWGGFVEIRRAAREGREPLKDVFAFATSRLSPQWRGTVLLSRGFSDSSADWGAGTQVAYEF